MTTTYGVKPEQEPLTPAQKLGGVLFALMLPFAIWAIFIHPVDNSDKCDRIGNFMDQGKLHYKWYDAKHGATDADVAWYLNNC